MLTVRYNGQEEALTHVTGYQRRRKLNDELSLSLASLDVTGNPGHALLQEDAIITTVDGYEFRVLQVSSTRGRKDIEAISTFYDLGGVIKHEIFGGTKTLRQFIDWVLAGTGWTAEIVDVTQSALVPNFGDGENALKLIEQLLGAFECERQILPGKRIRFAKQIGPKRDKQFRYGHNVQALTHSVDMTDVRVKITGYGGDGLKVTYTSPNAAKFPEAGEAEPFEDDRFTVAASLTERLKQELKDTPDIVIEVDTAEVGDVEEGETVWLIYEPLDIELETRVIEDINTDPERPKRGTVTLGNATRKRIEDQLTDTNIRVDENHRQVESSIEQTNERITTEVTDITNDMSTRFEQTSEYIRMTAEASEQYTDERYGEVTREMAAQFEITAEAITSSVTESKSYTDSRELIIKDAIGAAETRWGNDLSNVGKQVTTIDGQVGTIVDELGTLDTELATIKGDVVSVREEFSSKIDQTARKIELEVTGMIEYTDQAEADAIKSANGYTNGQITTVRTEATSNFNILAGRINAKAEATTVSSLGTRVSTVEQDLNAVTGVITNKVSYTDYTGQTIISKVNQTASSYKVDAKNIELAGITEVAGSLRIGNSRDPGTRLEFYNSGFYRPYINAYGGSVGSGLTMFASDIDINAGNALNLGSSATRDVYAHGRWDVSRATMPGITKASGASNELMLSYTASTNVLYVWVDGSVKGYLDITPRGS